MSKSLIEKRKSEHLRIVSLQDVEHQQSTLLEDVQLLHQALPEIDPEDICFEQQFFGRKLRSPFMITSMTGGAEFAEELNVGLAQVASNLGIAFALGSQRVLLRHPEFLDHFAVRKYIPEGVLLGNIGGLQLLEYSLDDIVSLVELIDGDGICVHLNIAQELVQGEDQHHFRGILDQLARLVDRLPGKVLIKETGAGFSPQTLEKIAKIGVPYLDVSGAGGTSWTKVEMHRASDPYLHRLGETFSDWGVPTAFSLIAAKHLLRNCRLIGSGGIRHGLDAARAIAIGADVIGFAKPVLLAFLEKGIEGAASWIREVELELKTAMLLTGACNLEELHRTPRVYTGALRDWLKAYGWLDGDKN